MDVIAFALLRGEDHVVAFFWDRVHADIAARMFNLRIGTGHHVKEIMCHVSADALDKVSRDLVVI